VDSNAIETNEVSNPTVAMQIPSLLDESPKPKMRPVYSADQLSQAVFVELEAQSAREIQVDFLIQGILVGDEKICRAMARDGRVYLVGLKTGETIIEVQPVDGNPARLLRAKVVMPWQRSNGLTDLDPLLHAIQPLCPNGELTLRAQEDGSVVVKGKVDSQETAKRIMELTRKLILAPVVDKLEIR
jgi:Flp pilus assembly secretin CpaC